MSDLCSLSGYACNQREGNRTYAFTPPTQTQAKRSYAGYTIRQGMAIILEHNFMMRPVPSGRGLIARHAQCPC